jgi:hypothetical protein
MAALPQELAMSEDRAGGASTALRVADWLSLAAAPTFAVMALLTACLGGARPALLCSAIGGASPMTGMVTMYVLMSAFHSAPWLKLVSSWRASADRVAATRPSEV